MFLHLEVEGLKLVQQAIILVEHIDLGDHLNKGDSFIRCSKDGLWLGLGALGGIRYKLRGI